VAFKSWSQDSDPSERLLGVWLHERRRLGHGDSVAISATVHTGPPGLSSSNSTGTGCKRARVSRNESDSVTEEEGIDSG
jgi:hypothetical protein